MCSIKLSHIGSDLSLQRSLQVQMVTSEPVCSQPHSNVRLLIAATAFGMGIDSKDIRSIIHWWDPPNNIKEYIQETGHAGRNGMQYARYESLPGEAVLFLGKLGFETYVENDVACRELKPLWNIVQKIL